MHKALSLRCSPRRSNKKAENKRKRAEVAATRPAVATEPPPKKVRLHVKTSPADVKAEQAGPVKAQKAGPVKAEKAGPVKTKKVAQAVKAGVPAKIAILSCKLAAMAARPKTDGPTNPQAVNYKQGVIYTSIKTRRFRALTTRGDTYTEKSAGWGKDETVAWSKCIKAIDDAA